MMEISGYGNYISLLVAFCFQNLLSTIIITDRQYQHEYFILDLSLGYTVEIARIQAVGLE